MKDIQITAFKSIRDSKTPYYISLEKSIKRIQTGVSKEPEIEEDDLAF